MNNYGGKILMITAAFFAALLSGCSRVDMNNPVDPDSSQYIGYKSIDYDGDGRGSYTDPFEDIDGQMVLFPAGQFSMGTDEITDFNVFYDERPSHTVYLNDFSIDKYEVTNDQFARFLNSRGSISDYSSNPMIDLQKSKIIFDFQNGYQPQSKMKYYPVTGVTWYGASAYAFWAGKRLPTEAEWERAARGKTISQTKYPWGSQPNAGYDQANTNGVRGADLWEKEAPAGTFLHGDLYDPFGNVSEWCSDWYDDSYYSNFFGTSYNPSGPGAGSLKVVRGGSYNDYAVQTRYTKRFYQDPASAFQDVGFRCAK